MTKEERLLRQEQRERAKAIEAAAREAGRGPIDLPYLLLVLSLVGVGLIMLFSASFPSAYYEVFNKRKNDVELVPHLTIHLPPAGGKLF